MNLEEVQLAAYQSAAFTWLLNLALEDGQRSHIPDNIQTGIRELAAATEDRLMKAVATPGTDH
jgi:hypothetical protein